ncbi:MAG: hypothetical protein HOY69_04150, partial [Streptomyces sp.]|nr:hypothetical protein [Streptomyces sp.]
MRPNDTTWVSRFAASPPAPAVTAALLATAAVAEASVRAAVTGGHGRLAFSLLAAVVLALATTVPPAFLSAASAAVAVSGAGVLSLAVFGEFTGAGALAVPMAL